MDNDGDLDISAVDEIADHLYIFLNADSACIAKAGDTNLDKQVTLSDIIFLIDYLFKSGQKPHPFCTGDANGDGKIKLSDVVTLVNFLFKSGSSPVKFNVCCL